MFIFIPVIPFNKNGESKHFIFLAPWQQDIADSRGTPSQQGSDTRKSPHKVSVNSKSIKILLLFFHSRRTKIPEASEQRSTNHPDRSRQIRHLQKEDAGTTQNKGPTAEKRLQGLERAH